MEPYSYSYIARVPEFIKGSIIATAWCKSRSIFSWNFLSLKLCSIAKTIWQEVLDDDEFSVDSSS